MAGVSSSGGGDEGMVSGINVTPLVDVTLVLLIIFMVTAKLLGSQSLPLDVPKIAGTGEIQTIFGVELRADGSLAIDGQPVANDEMIFSAAKAAIARTPDVRAVIRADTTAPHGRVIRALDLLKQAGIGKIAFAMAPAVVATGAVPAPAAKGPGRGGE